MSPNPTSGQITLDGNILMIGSEISIRNTSGTEVYHSLFRSKTFDLPSSLPAGVYMLTLQTKDKKVYTRKIILNR
ncbi:T9SS type A sorting domain-containing protein [Chryseobacterium tructae]|uniref:T9SS type A sorting domain-containing protein n=1 Tax=Chryseobacterium tructae TaxID=1037380 RepID=UPI0025B460C7|nr:T9SS type A sorting domain-containing protein [Chryseobacterium tructae]MDN3695152.1 T9SS type A sorting domain-containing protein [Chryseobacterium tructae]